MKNFIFILLFIIGAVHNGKCQYFCGELNYKTAYISSGKMAIYIFDKHYIKNNAIKLFKSYSINLQDNGYSLLKDTTSYSVDNDNKEIKKNIGCNSSEISKNKYIQTSKQERILGYLCTIYKRDMIINGKRETEKMWVTDSIKIQNINWIWFSTNYGVVLKIVTPDSNGSLISEIESIIPREFDPSFFDLPDYPIKEVDMTKLANSFLNKK